MRSRNLVDFNVLIYVKLTVTSYLLNMVISFWLRLFITKLHSQKDIFKNVKHIDCLMYLHL